MKKTTILFAIVSITLFACNDKNPLKPGALAKASTFVAADSLPGAVAGSMIDHFLDTVLVDHSPDSIVRQASLYNSDLYEIFKMDNITRIRLLSAAYLNTDTFVARRNKLTVIVQLKQGYNSNYYYYDIQTFGDQRLCPPPDICDGN
jgi:hypothetical protein